MNRKNLHPKPASILLVPLLMGLLSPVVRADGETATRLRPEARHLKAATQTAATPALVPIVPIVPIVPLETLLALASRQAGYEPNRQAAPQDLPWNRDGNPAILLLHDHTPDPSTR